MTQINSQFPMSSGISFEQAQAAVRVARQGLTLPSGLIQDIRNAWEVAGSSKKPDLQLKQLLSDLRRFVEHTQSEQKSNFPLGANALFAGIKAPTNEESEKFVAAYKKAVADSTTNSLGGDEMLSSMRDFLKAEASEKGLEPADLERLAAVAKAFLKLDGAVNTSDADLIASLKAALEGAKAF
ncbi:hypothetical protein cym2001_57210 [Pseudomonas sp. CYM-20-01]|uniref:hypothetical protein n=1 Tax=Pseudomonas sp. CYM-20-01 TaxID=2870750 RepID=UPI0020561CDC|nr:hypothetical protein [Pseudomonas sp. CYM-20-01]BDB22356.1 hypothetical protein cym2001_57210 [Pseudomonas sp. CYM-20-01]